MAETGHAKNVANFGQMISFCVGYGGDYKPSNAAIQQDWGQQQDLGQTCNSSVNP